VNVDVDPTFTQLKLIETGQAEEEYGTNRLIADLNRINAAEMVRP